MIELPAGEAADPDAPPGDLLQQSFRPRPPAQALDFADVHRRYPALAEFGASVGDTPLIQAPSMPGGAQILAKHEWHNPVGSIKDRTAYALVADAVRAHGSRPINELKLVTYSGGDLAAAMSLLGQRMGIRMLFVLASYAPGSLLDLLTERGAEVALVPKERGFLATIRTAQQVAADDPSWTLVFQHANPVNVAVHEHTTGAEIVRQLGGAAPELWIASIGSGGTLIGVLRALRSVDPRVRAIGVTPAEAPYANPVAPSGDATYEGSGGHGYGIRQPFVRAYEHVIEAHRHVDLPTALAGMTEYFDWTGTRIGSSAAANWLIAREYARQLPATATVVTVFPCAGTPEQWKELGR